MFFLTILLDFAKKMNYSLFVLPAKKTRMKTMQQSFGIFHIELHSKRKYAKNELLNNCFFWSTGTIFISDNN